MTGCVGRQTLSCILTCQGNFVWDFVKLSLLVYTSKCDLSNQTSVSRQHILGVFVFKAALVIESF